MFRLSQEESDSLSSQTVILEPGRGKYRKFLPYAFTEQGVAMLSGILHKLLHCAQVCRVGKIMRPYLEALL
jgi:hypothetical protein